MARMFRRLVPVALALAACGPDLPAGWEGAERVDALTQAECSGSPYEGYDERLEVSSPTRFRYRQAPFRCEQEVEAYYQTDGNAVEVLVQPVDMHPGVVAACDCLYDIDFGLVPPVGDDTLTLYRRWDGLNESNALVKVGEVSFTFLGTD